MNLDDEEDSDFNFSSQSNNKLASLFKSNNEPVANENLKYKPTKQPQAASSTTTSSQQSSVLFFSSVLAFKYLNGRYEPQAQGSKLGLAIINSQNTFRVLLYLNKTQPLANIKLSPEFRLAIQKNNYTSFYDESNQLWSILFDNEDQVASFGTNIALCKCNILQGNIPDKLYQDLKSTDSEIVVESGDSVEIVNLITVWKDMKLQDVVENNLQKPVKLRLGKNKLPQYIEDSIIDMKQGDRRLFVIKGARLQSHYPNLVNSVIFYDINILRIKKNTKERSNSNVTNDSIPLPQVNLSIDSEQEVRSRSESIRDKSKTLSDHILDPKSEKAKLISRMAKMGQQTLPTTNNTAMNVIENDNEDWEVDSKLLNQESSALASAFKAATNMILFQQQQQQQLPPQQQQLTQQMKQQLQQQLQNEMQQKLQQQLPLQQQQQFYQTANPTSSSLLNPSNNQLALYSTPSPQLVVYPPTQTPVQFENPQQQISQPKSSIDPESTSKILGKLELITEKIDQVKTITQINNQNMPNMETSILLQNIQRIVRENEQYKKDLYEKSNKIEEQNTKITELLTKAQNYVEQSHLILEQKNSSFQSTAEKNVNKVLELEQDKMKLTSDLSTLTSKISELNLEINKMQKADLELRQQLSEVSKNTDQYKQNSERLLVENADLQTKLDTCMAEFKKERQLRKSIETKLQLNEDELVELRAGSSTSQKLIEERKRRLEEEKNLHEKELDELKRAHLNEINVLKEKIAKLKSDSNESQSEQIKQIESDLNKEWSIKLEKSIQQSEQKLQRQIDQLNDEKININQQLEESKELVKQLRLNLSNSDAEKDKLRQDLDEIQVFKQKYERLQSQALVMKERYENRIQELLEAEPDPEVIGEEVKKTMNAIYRKLKSQIKPEQFYAGNGILTAMLKIIKMVTLQILHKDNQEEEQQEQEDVDYFSEHIYKTVIVETKQSITTETSQYQSESSGKDELKPSLVEDDRTQVNDQEAVLESTDKFEEQVNIDEKVQEINLEENLETKTNQENTKKEDSDDEDDDIQLIEEESGQDKNEIGESNRLRTNSSVENEIKINDIVSNDNHQDSIDDNTSKNEIDSSHLQQALEKSEVEIITGENKVKNIDSVGDDEEDDHEGEFDVYEKETSQTVSVSVSKKPANNSLFDDDEDEEEDGLFSAKNQPENIIKPNVTDENLKKKSLFEDDDDGDDVSQNDGLFSFTSSAKDKEAATKLNEKNDLLKTTSTTKSDNEENPIAQESSSTSSSTNNKEQPTVTTTTAPSQQSNLKFSPPPLFDNDQDEDDNEIDWFK